jgi:hypothetical protein
MFRYFGLSHFWLGCGHYYFFHDTNILLEESLWYDYVMDHDEKEISSPLSTKKYP